MRGTTLVRVLAVPNTALIAAAGAVLQSMARMVAERMRSVTMDAIVAAAGAIVQRMARMMGDRVVSCPHDICRSIRRDSFKMIPALSVELAPTTRIYGVSAHTGFSRTLTMTNLY